ncbi:MAG TPA: sulfite exporter TauE/SafE family protein, partial [Nitrospinaceae bacterium]|nr:sulfite exporter TauE/SafE family protein [Nitrospinaceae bacterium]
VYGLSIAPREAFGISLVAVGVTALIALIHRIRAGVGEIELRTGVLFAVAGMIGAPAGILLAGKIPENVLLILFAVLMLSIAWKMWKESYDPVES